MSLTILNNLVQGSAAWEDARQGILTASVIGKLVTPTLKAANNDTSRGVTATLVAERLTHHTEETVVSRAMERGTLDEPYARDLYTAHYAPVTEVGFMMRDIDGDRLGYSPDGLVGDDGLIEIKSRTQRIQLQTILDDAVPTMNMAQLQTGLLVSGREWIDYVSYCGGMPLYVKRVHPDDKWQEVITEVLHKFEDTARHLQATYKAATKGLPATERIDHFQEIY